MSKVLIKGNEAVVRGALLAGCKNFFGYPITPASEIAEAAAYYFPLLGGTFLQAESEIGAINMVYGAASSPFRCMTASSSPGISLKMEGISYIAGAELPCVIIDIMRGGPGLGNIAPEQADYNQIVKGGGHGNYRLITLAPNSAQEMCDLTMLAFELSDKYRNPAVVLADGIIGQMMEPVEFPEPVQVIPERPWALKGSADSHNLVCSIELEPDRLEEHNRKLQEKYAGISRQEIRCETIHCEDAEHIFIGYGVVSRILHSVVESLRAEGIKAGLLRPITLFPFPAPQIEHFAASKKLRSFFVCELSAGQMVDDVRLAVNGRKPVHLHTRMGGNVPSVKEIVETFKASL
ncbi:MAG: 3-methyl-2-oxobutanoate dehydrogenase subunit VorB [Candidatus Neomarinimicrobiota bacterium]|jgi:pyruvate/2-oxoacid:ferredoxin oxidoreductase alpha subunit|nr:3-methyl-2-oxobutanoate dehydrogenase subunit VorB [Candidatus Neomarinimicrobiota bacterium]MDX9780145.1 3-methyl-2-oxobutanoate dehydrogenase subunit VorB [bacterium]